MHKNEGPSEMRWGLIGKSGGPGFETGNLLLPKQVNQ